MPRTMMTLITVLLLVPGLAFGQQVKTFYTSPVTSYSSEYALAGVPLRQQPQPAALHSQTNFVPLGPTAAATPAAYAPLRAATFAAIPASAAVPSARLARFPQSAPIRRIQFYPTAQVASVRARTPPFHVPAAGAVNTFSGAANVAAVPAFPLTAGVRAVSALGRATVPSLHERISYPPTPYAFDYSVNTAEGNHGRQESGDGSGRVTGSYTIQLADGRTRAVEYSADEAGYRANVKTNEFGTESQSPADVAFLSSAIPAREAVLIGERDPAFRQYGPAHHNKA